MYLFFANMNFDLYNNLLPKTTTASSINTEIHALLGKMNHLYAMTGSDHFKQHIESVKEYIQNLPDEKCVSWGINKQSYNIQPTDVPSVPLYGLLQREPSLPSEHKHQECDELFNPKYTMKLFTNLQQARNAESASILTCMNTYEKLASFQHELYHPKLYKIVCEPVVE